MTTNALTALTVQANAFLADVRSDPRLTEDVRSELSAIVSTALASSLAHVPPAQHADGAEES